jgi:hypothetical protein
MPNSQLIILIKNKKANDKTLKINHNNCQRVKLLIKTQSQVTKSISY